MERNYLSLRVSDDLNARLIACANSAKLPKSTVVKTALEYYLAQTDNGDPNLITRLQFEPLTPHGKSPHDVRMNQLIEYIFSAVDRLFLKEFDESEREAALAEVQTALETYHV